MSFVLNTKMNSFGQEFYPYESIRALKFADKTKLTDRHTLIEHLATQLPQPSQHTRWRIATKFAQRYLNGTRRNITPPPHCQPFVRLVARQRHTPTQIELLYLRLSKVDSIVGALARDLFYPVCIAERPPEGFSSAEFAARNGGQLFSTSPLLTHSFIFHYARARWNFQDRATIDRSLRVLQGAGLIARERMLDLRGHPTAFRLSQHNVSLTTFLYAFYEEFLPHARSGNLAVLQSVLPITDFARTLLLTPSQVMEHCEAARQHQLVAQQSDQLRLVFGNLDAVVDTLLTKAL